MGSENHAKVGIIFDWENYWALEYTSGPNRDLRYVDQIEQMYNYFYNKNIAVDMIPIDADFSKYDLVAAPVLYMVKDGVAESLEAYVQAGGTLITTYMSGIVGQSDNVHLGGYPGPLRKMAGVCRRDRRSCTGAEKQDPFRRRNRGRVPSRMRPDAPRRS